MQNKKKLTGYPSIDKPWLKYYSEEAINAKLPECTIYEYLWENNKDHLDDIALIYFGRKITYGELFKNIETCEKSLYEIGIREKDIVTIALPSIPEAIYLVYALNKLGAVANMIHPLAGENEIVHYLNEVNTKVFFMFTGTYDIVKDSLDKTTVRNGIVVSASDSLPFGIKQIYLLKTKEPKLPTGKKIISFKNFLAKGKKTTVTPIKKNGNDIAIISHTGGTTGEPKGVMLTDRNINTVIWEIGCNLPHQRQETMLVVLPPFINYSLVNGMLEPLAFGFKVVLIPKYEPDKFDEYIEKYRFNHVNSIPSYWEALLTNERLKKMDLSCLKHFFYGGDSMSAKKENEVNELLASCGVKYKLAKGLGSTEMVSAATATYQDCNVLGSVGIPLVKVNCKIIDVNNGNECSYNQEGEICFSGPQMMVGYYENQAATDDIIKKHADGERWIHTGDLGYLNEDGVLFISGRIKRIIVTKGNDGIATKMFPDRIEKTIISHPAVSLCCVVGIPHEQRINVAKAAIVLNENYNQSDELLNEIIALCKAELPEYLMPEIYVFLDDLPRTARGKVDFRALEKEAEKI